MSIPAFRWSCGRAEQVGQPDQVVGGHRQSELESQACDSAQHGPRETTDGLGPPERLLSALALLLADRITRMARRASVDRRGPIGCVLRSGVTLRSRRSSMDSHFVSLVGVRRRDPGEWRTIIVWAASRSMVPVAEPSSASTHDEHFSGRRHAGCGLGLDEELPRQGQLGRAAVGRRNGERDYQSERRALRKPRCYALDARATSAG